MIKKRNECSICGAKIKKGDFVGVTGNWPGFFNTALIWPNLDNHKIYCKSCFNKSKTKVKK